ncbi:MAG: Na/Pi cotransporter family protein [Lachnospiraceae bacterium]|nr:Na/Pi cotransporter family protein [Candidatus Merdinaster equi]
MDAATIISSVLGLLGGLGLFLLGMRLMSESIEKVAGAKLRSILEFFTTNRFTGMLVGLVFTGIIQSSSASTVMVVSFVNSGLMNLGQAAGVIFGANIGTTVTSQLVSIKLDAYAPIILLLGVVFVMFSKNQTVNKIASILVGFGVLFLGLSMMKDSMQILKEEPHVVSMFASLKSPVFAILLGTVLTAIIQSSSVTVSIMVLLAGQGLLSLNICMYIILGCNIGACTSALLSSFSGGKNAKRAALIHLLFNVIGTILMFIALQIAAGPIEQGINALSNGDAERFVANAHTIFKVVQVLVLLPFSNLIVKMTYLFVRGEDKKISYRENFQLKYIGEKSVFNPTTAVVGATKEIERMASLAEENLNRAMNALITLDQEDITEVYMVEKNINFLNKSITNYLVKVNQTLLPLEDQKIIGALFHVVNDVERIGDHAENVADAARTRIETGVSFSKTAQRELGEMLDMVNKMIHYSIELFVTGKEEHVADINMLEEKVDAKERELQRLHVDRLTRNECTPEAGMLYSDVVSGLERVADHAVNIAFCVINAEQEEAL